jgi:hypothetical protein
VPISRRRKPKDKPREDRFRINDTVVSQDQLMAKVNQMAQAVDDFVRVCFLGDPEMGGGTVATGVDLVTGVVTHADSKLEESIPVARFEPPAVTILRKPGGPVMEIQAEAAISMGMRPYTRGASVVDAARGWKLCRTGSGLELYDTSGGVFSRGTVTLPPQWISAAVSQRHVLVVYGGRTGVRVPDGMDEDAYTPQMRWHELRDSMGMGVVAAGLVPFVNRA